MMAACFLMPASRQHDAHCHDATWRDFLFYIVDADLAIYYFSAATATIHRHATMTASIPKEARAWSLPDTIS